MARDGINDFVRRKVLQERREHLLLGISAYLWVDGEGGGGRDGLQAERGEREQED